MKVIYLNNYHYIRGGSERIFFGEMDMLKEYGHDVAGFARKHNLDLPSKYEEHFPQNIITDKVQLSWTALKTLKEIFYSQCTRDGLERVISKFQPNVAHLHNIYGRLTTSVIDLLFEKKIPIVMTLHDCKLACPSYLFMRNRRVCEDCKGGRYYMAAWNRCHKGSYAASAIVAIESYLNEWSKKYRQKIQVLITPSYFLKNKMVECGWPAHQIKHVKNFLDLTKIKAKFTGGDYFLYIGRLSEEKGIATLINAYQKSGLSMPGLVIAGEGPMRAELENLAQGNSSIKFTGYLSGQQLQDTIRDSLSVVVPSVCYENAPLSILEAMAYGKPVIGARIGGIPEMVLEENTGFLFEPGNCVALSGLLNHLAHLPPGKIEGMGVAARKHVKKHYSTDSHYRGLMMIYQDLLLKKENQCTSPT